MSDKLGATGLTIHDEKFWGIYRAKVINNIDPLQQGRIKAEVIPYFVGIDQSIIPWAVPKNPAIVGAGAGIGSSFIPVEGTMVWVFFEMGDIYQPVYDGEASDGVHGLPTFMATDYPNTRGFQTSSGVIFTIDDTTKTISLIHPTGTTIVVDTAGDVTVTSVEDVVVNVTRDITMFAGRDVNITAAKNLSIVGEETTNITFTGAANITCDSTLVINGPSISINP